MATQRMNDSWARVKSEIETIWGDAEFDDKEMKKARGNLPKMVDLIQEKTGESREDIMQKIIAIL